MSAPMRIAVATTEFPSVSNTFVLDHVTALARRGHDVEILPSRRGARGEHADAAVRVRFPPDPRLRTRWQMLSALWQAGGPAVVYRAAALARLYRLHRTQRFDRLSEALPFLSRRHEILHCHFGYRALQMLPLFATRLLRLPLVVTFHGHDVQGFLGQRPVDSYAALFASADRLLVPSAFMRGELLRLGAPPEKLTVLPNGLALARFPFAPRRPPPAGEALNVITVARLVEKKGIAFGIEAVARLAASGIAVRYVIVGDGPRLEPLRRQARQAGIADRVELLGAQSRAVVLEQLARAHVFVAPGIVTPDGDVETQGMALLEAQACGVAVVATSVGGVPESVPPDAGDRTVPAADAAALEATLRHVIAQPQKWGEWGAAGRAHVEANFDQERQIDLLVGHYRQLVDGSGA